MTAPGKLAHRVASRRSATEAAMTAAYDSLTRQEHTAIMERHNARLVRWGMRAASVDSLPRLAGDSDCEYPQ